MASSKSYMKLFLFALFMLFISNATPEATVAAEEFKVGDDEGWRQPPVNHTFMYNLWASRRNFHVGDTLRFVYKNDSVLVVDKWGYYHCNSSNPISVFNDGNTVVALDKPGQAYFISGDPDRCNDGQRLEIEVLSIHPPSPPAPEPENPRRPPHAPIPPAAAPSPSSNSGVKSFGTSFLVSGVSVVIVMASLLV